MSLIALQSLQQFSTKGDSRVVGPALEDHRPVGHPHFWERAMARRQFITTAAGTFGLVLGSGVLGSGLWRPQLARAATPAGADPKPIPAVSNPLAQEQKSSISSCPGSITTPQPSPISTASSV